MSRCIRLALLAYVVANVISGTCGGKTYDLRTFYHKAASAVLKAAAEVLKRLPKSTDDQSELTTVINAHNSMAFHVQACKEDKTTNKTCTCFNVYKEAFLLMSDLLALQWRYKNLSDDVFAPIDEVYKKWTGICPQYRSFQKVSLFYTPTDEYLSHGLKPESRCCDAKYSVRDRESNFFLRRWDNANIKTLVYGDTIGLGYKDGVYLSNDGNYMSWFRRKLGEWEKFRLENGCQSSYEIYGNVHMCDLVMFHGTDEGSYLQLLERTRTHGLYNYAILDRLGNIPSW